MNKLTEIIGLFFATFFVFIQPIVGLFFLVLVFMLVDTGYAIYSVVRVNKGWSKFSSRKLSDIIVKGVIYGGGVLVSHMIDSFILKDSLLFGIPPVAAKVTAFVILFIEGKSIDETRIKLGKRSFFVMLREWINKGKRFKQDVNDLIQ
jgi:hypothetical protein